MEDRFKKVIIEIKGLDNSTSQAHIHHNRLWILFKGTTHVKLANFMDLKIENTVFYAGCVIEVDINEPLEIKEAIFMQGTHSFKEI